MFKIKKKFLKKMKKSVDLGYNVYIIYFVFND